MVVAAVDTALAAFLRAALPLPEEVGDISFDAPDRTWGAQLSKVTVNAYLYDVGRSPLPGRPGQERVRTDGRTERRGPAPQGRLSYMVTAWAGSTADEHVLLGELLDLFAGVQALPAAFLPDGLEGPVQLAISQREGRRPGDLWQGLDGRLKPVVELDVTVPLPGRDWQPAPPAVTRVAPSLSDLAPLSRR